MVLARRHQGDKEATKKRDDVGAKLDAASLAAARAAVQTFTAQPQPDEAISVKTPPGGWDRPAAENTPARSRGGMSHASTLLNADREVIFRYISFDLIRAILYLWHDAASFGGRAPNFAAQFKRGSDDPKLRRRACKSTFRSPISRSTFSAARHGAGGRIHFGNVRGRRRLPDDAASDLHRRPARGRGGERHEPHRGVVLFRRHQLLARKALDIPLAGCCWPAAFSAPPAASGCSPMLRSLDLLDLMIALSYVILLAAVGGLMVVESVRAIVRSYQGKPVVLRRPGSHTWLHGLPLKMRFKRSKIYVSAIPVLGIGFVIGFHRRHHGHRRRLSPGADADLFHARADLDRDRHVHGADARHHGVRDRDACGDQPSGRCRARPDADGRRRHRRAIRRARRPEHEPGAAAACCSA